MCEYGYIPLYYPTPIVVKYYNHNLQNKYAYGLGYKDEIIDLDTLTVLTINVVIQDAIEHCVHFDDAIIETNLTLTWQ